MAQHASAKKNSKVQFSLAPLLQNIVGAIIYASSSWQKPFSKRMRGTNSAHFERTRIFE